MDKVVSLVKQNGDLAANQYNLGISQGLFNVQAYSTRSVLLSLSNISEVNYNPKSATVFDIIV
ncbi:hypothetical protein [Clostridium akagii]|uniref:hypothetical protein n=1 Tax=Clostridium akagii TaxID=91623 RepID=UPI00047EFBDA|nr:hypothetical protein [Clostridium akagii]